MSKINRLKDVERKFCIGDHVLAKVRTYSFWPACVTRIISRAQYEVTFYETKQKNVVNKGFIIPYSLDNVKKYIKVPPNVKNAILEIEDAIRKKKEGKRRVRRMKLDEESFKHLYVEVEIVEVYTLIMSSLVLGQKFDFKNCSDALDRAGRINFTPLMIKKRSEFIEVLDKVTRLRTLELKPQECQVLRAKAARVLDQIRILFGIDKEVNFIEFFNSEMKIFKERVKDLDESEYNLLK